jgi:assimilatory nitrate reductase catalytic subunit
MGFGEAFSYRTAADVFREHAALSAYENDGRRDFDIGAFAEVSESEFDTLSPFQWPRAKAEAAGETRFFAKGGFFTPDRKARFIAPERPVLQHANSDAFPFTLNTGRIRDQWHTMTRTGLSPRLASHIAEPFVEIHPDDAFPLGLRDGDLARVATRHGSAILKARVTPTQRKGSLFVPIHWSDANASAARIGEMVNPATDPDSGQPEAKATPACIARVDFRFAGFMLSRKTVALPASSWWVKPAIEGGEGTLLASNDGPTDWRNFVHAQASGNCCLSEFLDQPRGIYRAALFANGRLEFCLFIGPASLRPQWDAARALLAAGTLEERQRRVLLSGQSADGVADNGPIVCACFGIGLKLIRDALATGPAKDVAGIGKALRAGTNCGSCLPELKRIVAHGQQHDQQRTAQAV